jgi:hypothetical protein
MSPQFMIPMQSNLPDTLPDRHELTTRTVNGLPVFNVPADFPLVTDDLVRELLEESTAP